MARRRKKFNNPFANDNPITDAGNTAHNVGSGKGGGGGGGNGYSAAGSGVSNFSSGVGTATGTSPVSSATYGASSVAAAASGGKPPPAPTPTFYNPTDSHTTVDLKPLVGSITDPAVRSLAPAAIRAGLRYEVNPSILLGAAKVTDYGRSGKGRGYTNLGDGSETGAKSIAQAAKYLSDVGFQTNPRAALKKLAAQTGGNAADIRKTAAGYTELDNAVRKVQAVPGDTQARGVGKLPHREARAVAQGVATAGVVGSRATGGYESPNARAAAEGQDVTSGGPLSKQDRRAAQAIGAGLQQGGRAATDKTANVVGRAVNQSAGMVAGRGQELAAGGRRARAPQQGAGAFAPPTAGPRPRRVAARLEKAANKVSAQVPDYVPEQYRGLIANASKQYGVPAGLLSALLQQESGFAEDVIRGTRDSTAGAQGIAQFMPETAAGMNVDPLDPKSAIPGAARLLSGNKDQFGSWDLALAAYNAGGGAVSQYGGIPPYAETQNYVKTIMANAGDTSGGGASAGVPKKLVQRGYDVLGREATKALLNGGSLVKAPKGGVKQTRFSGRYAGSQSVVRYLVGTKVKGDHGGTKNGEAPGVHSPDGDHYRADGYAQDINGTSPGENEPAYDQATLDKIVSNIKKAGYEGPDPTGLQIGENWEGTVGKYSVQLLTNEGGTINHIHIGAHPTDGEGGGGAPAPLIPIKGTGLAVKPPAPVSSGTTSSSSGALTGATGTTAGGATGLASAIDTASKARQGAPISAGGIIPRSSAAGYARSALAGATTAEGASPLDRYRTGSAPTGDPILEAFRPRRRRS